MNKEELIKEYDEKAKALRDEFISKLEDDKEEIESSYPEKGSYIFVVDSYIGNIVKRKYAGDEFDRFLFEHGYFFKSKEEVEKHLKKCKLLFTIKQWAKEKNDGWVPDWSDYSNDKFLIYYDGEDGLLRINAGSINNTLSSLPTLKTRKIAQECIDLFGDEIKEVLC